MMRRYRVEVVQHAKDQANVTVYIHPSADVSADATIGEGTRIWQQAQVCPGARIGAGCILGKGVYVESGVDAG
jgi:UDP-2-acetamido-3-amino-2,3-dideoxy-glucuronate N-acetyltransferase